MRQFCTFHLAGRLFGVDILDVKEINPEIRFTPIFHAPEEVKGYVSIRGQLYLILDLRLLLGFESKKADDASRLILFKQEVGEPFGVLADSIGDVAEVDSSLIETRDIHDSLPQEEGTIELCEGVCKLEQGLMVILNSRNLLKKLMTK